MSLLCYSFADGSLSNSHLFHQCNAMAIFLSEQGIKAKPFHRGIKQHELDMTLKQWIDGKVDCVVATVAFGMASWLPQPRGQALD